jgi:hypothetical protein
LLLKKHHSTEREMTTPLFLLRCVQIGLSISELDLLTIGTVNDMYAEMSNDDYPYAQTASQVDMDRF